MIRERKNDKKNIYFEGELDPEATIRKFRMEGRRQVDKQVDFFNLDMIIAVGYRVRSHCGTQFRIWANQRLREYIVKGFTLDDERLKQAGGGNYFDELLARIRDICASEKVFWVSGLCRTAGPQPQTHVYARLDRQAG